jgi:DNA-binding transcriptional ArsR family regulator
MLTSTGDSVDMNVELRALAEKQATICSIFANAKRVMILWSLTAGEMSVGEIASIIEASLQNTSQHLHLMKKMGILDSRRDGQMIYYRIAKNGHMRGCQFLLQVYPNGR